eukprot:Rmarinus@m.24456
MSVPHCPEDFVFCIDLCNEMDNANLSYGKVQPTNGPNSGTLTRLDVVRQGITLLVQTKAALDNRHRFALCTLLNEAQWCLDLTDAKSFLEHLSLLQPAGDFRSFNMNSLGETLQRHCGSNLQPETPRLLRVVFVYGRSSVVPTFSAPEGRGSILRQLCSLPMCYFDCVYIHDVPSDTNHCQEVFDVFLDMEDQARMTDRHTYLFETSKSARKVHLAFAKLVTHPLQRKPLEEHVATLYERDDAIAATAVSA